MSNLPVPIFTESEMSSSVVKMFVAEWLSQPNYQSLTQWKVFPKFHAQILGMKMDEDLHKMFVKISDGTNWIAAELSSDMMQLARDDHFKIFDIVLLMKTEGSPHMSNFKIVSYFLEIFIFIMFYF